RRRRLRNQRESEQVFIRRERAAARRVRFDASRVRAMGQLGECDGVAMGVSQRGVGAVAAGVSCAGSSRVADCEKESGMMITLLHPIWLALAIPLAAAWLVWRPSSRFLRCARWAVLLLILLALCGLAVNLPSRNGTIVVVADRSLSMPQGAEA